MYRRCRCECDQPTALEQLARNLDASTIYPNRRILRADIDAPMNRQDMIASNKQSARDLLAGDNGLADIESLWDG